MERATKQTESPADCWVDLFDADYFMGRRHRLHGPQKLTRLHAKSIIVGPKAKVVLTIFRGKKKSVIRLNPSRVIPDLAKRARGAKLGEALVESVK